MPPTTRLAAFPVNGHAWHCSVVAVFAPLVTFAIVPDANGAQVVVSLRRPLPVWSIVPIAQWDDGSRTVVVLMRQTDGLAAISIRYAATFLHMQPWPVRSALLANAVHVDHADAFEVALAPRTLLDDLQAARAHLAARRVPDPPSGSGAGELPANAGSAAVE
jgi:hypothetical protein